MYCHSSFSLSGLFMLLLTAVMPVWYFQTPLPSDPGDNALGEPLFLYPVEKNTNYNGCIAQSTPVLNAVFEQEVVEMVNAEREAEGLPPLKRTPQLDEAARYHAADMKQDNYFDHNSYDRVNNELQLACNWATRVGNYYSGSSTLGENIAFGYSSPEAVVEGWMNSSGHRANILSSNYQEIGVGYGAGNIWVQDFGTRPGVHPVIINEDAGIADSRDVKLYVYGTWKDIRIRNDSDPWSAWMPFQNTLAWQLPDEPGPHTVIVEMRAGTNTESSSDEIILKVLQIIDPLLPKLYIPFLVNPRQ